MSELPPDRDRLTAIRTYLRLQLAAVDSALAALDQAATEPAVGDAGDMRWWKLAPGRPATLHRGDCPRAPGQGPTITRDAARLSLTDRVDGQPVARPCPQCRPDIGLGVA